MLHGILGLWFKSALVAGRDKSGAILFVFGLLCLSKALVCWLFYHADVCTVKSVMND